MHIISYLYIFLIYLKNFGCCAWLSTKCTWLPLCVCVCAYARIWMASELLRQQDVYMPEKRTKTSLSIIAPLDVLRQRLLLEIARRQMRENSIQVNKKNNKILLPQKVSFSLSISSRKLKCLLVMPEKIWFAQTQQSNATVLICGRSPPHFIIISVEFDLRNWAMAIICAERTFYYQFVLNIFDFLIQFRLQKSRQTTLHLALHHAHFTILFLQTTDYLKVNSFNLKFVLSLRVKNVCAGTEWKMKGKKHQLHSHFPLNTFASFRFCHDFPSVRTDGKDHFSK